MARSALLALIAAAGFLWTACSSTMLDERFHGKELSNWTVIDDPETIEGPSQWQVEQDGWLHQRSNIWGRRGDYLGRWYGTMFVAGDTAWRDYTLSLKARPDDDDGFGVVFRFKDPEHFYRLFFIEGSMNGGPMARLDKREGADYTEIWAAPKGYRRGAEVRIEVEATGDTIRASLDGQSLFEVKDGSYRSGKVGLFCYAQSSQAFDDVKVVGR
ncbi:MAG TPA: family 16 glycoside hydrolase [Blastocatellia bacterium]|nr:family 16 glycoside hydrolase [Blastocatellia bacterium]